MDLSCFIQQGDKAAAVSSVETNSVNKRLVNWDPHVIRIQGYIIRCEEPSDAYLVWKAIHHCDKKSMLLQCGDIEQNPGPKVKCNKSR